MDLRTGCRLQSSPPKQRRGSLPSSPSLNTVAAWGFRDEMGLPTNAVPKEHVHERSQSTSRVPVQSFEETSTKRTRKKWTQDETQMLVDGCNTHGVGNWKAILNDPKLTFEPGRTPVDLKDRFRTYFPDAYRQHYPNARTHLSDRIRSALPNGGSIFEKTRTKRRRPFSPEEDDALRRGYEKHGTLWAQIVQDPVFLSQQRRSTDLRDRFRNAFPDLYEAAGYKPRTPSKKMSTVSHSARSVDGSSKPDSARSRAARRRLTYPGMLPGGNTTPASDSVDYSSADDEQPMDTSCPGQGPTLRGTLARHASKASEPPRRDVESLPSLPRRSTSPHLDHDSISLSSPPHFLSGPASPSSPRHQLSLPDVTSRDEDEAKAAWHGLDWLAPGSQSRPPYAPLTASSLFSANMLGSFGSSPSYDVVDRYDLYSSPLSSTAHTFGDYVSEMGLGGSFSEADMDLNAFAGPASSMGFTHHSHVAGDLIFASHHGGHLQHGHGYSLYDQSRSPYPAMPVAASSSQQVDSTLGLSNIPFTADTGAHEPHAQFDPHALDSMLNADSVSLALLSGSDPDLAQIPDVFPPTFAISPNELSQSSVQRVGGTLSPSITSPRTGALQPTPQHASLSPFLPAAEAEPKTIIPASASLQSSSPSPHVHLRSSSQPPTDPRLLDVRRNPLPTFAVSLSPPTSTRDDLVQDLWHRAPESYQVPFLDLHYYGVSDSHTSSATQGREPPTAP